MPCNGRVGDESASPCVLCWWMGVGGRGHRVERFGGHSMMPGATNLDRAAFHVVMREFARPGYTPTTRVATPSTCHEGGGLGILGIVVPLLAMAEGCVGHAGVAPVALCPAAIAGSVQDHPHTLRGRSDTNLHVIVPEVRRQHAGKTVNTQGRGVDKSCGILPPYRRQEYNRWRCRSSHDLLHCQVM